MKILYSPAHFGFNYRCIEYGVFLGNSLQSELQHPLRLPTFPIECPRSGECYTIPEHTVEVEVITPSLAPE